MQASLSAAMPPAEQPHSRLPGRSGSLVPRQALLRPLIGVTYSSAELDQFILWPRMFQGVVAAGGTPVAIDCLADEGGAGRFVPRLDGLILSGGGDVDPVLYGGDPNDPLLRGVNHTRDRAELGALEAARAEDVPILAICRGAQLVNVAMGGSLYADIARDLDHVTIHRESEEALVSPLHEVTVGPGSRLSTWTGEATTLAVNSQHHQGIRRLGARLSECAWSEDGLVEAFEHRDDRIVAVQWHPEVLWSSERHALSLLEAFIAECAPAGQRAGIR